MKKHKIKMIKKATIFVVILILILMMFNLIYITKVQKDKLLFRKDLEWQNYNNKIPNGILDYAFFGDSHTQFNLNPNHIKNSFNFGNAGDLYPETYFMIKRLIDKDKTKINYLILEIDPHSFSSKLKKASDLFREIDYYSFNELDTISKLRKESLLSVQIKNKIPVIGKAEEMLTYFLNPPTLTPLKLGWTNGTGDFSKKNKESLASIKYNLHFSTDPDLFENEMFTNFKKILDLAVSNKINIIFIKYPLTDAYNFELQKHNISIEKFYNKLFTEINKTTKEYFILDYQNLFSNQDQFFFDSDHLNSQGSTIFSQKVAKDLSRLINTNNKNSLKYNSSYSPLGLINHPFEHINKS